MEFFSQLFDTADFPARWSCGSWSSGHGWLHILSDLGVGAAHFAIPLVLGYFIARRKDLPFRSLFLLFAAFIVLCGTTHLMEAILFWWPAYRLAGVLKLLTAVVSWITVFALIRVAPTVLALRTPDKLEREITTRKQAEAEREQVAATLNSLVASAQVGIVLFDTEMRYRHINEPLAEMNGIPAADHLGKTVAEVVPDLYEQCKTVFRKVLDESVTVSDFLFEGETSKAPGVKRCWRASWFPVAGPEGKPSGVGAIVQEITEQRRAEERLRQSKERFRAVFEHALTGIAITAPDGRFLQCNRAFEGTVGYTEDELRAMRFTDIVHPDDRAENIAQGKRLLAREITSFEIENRYVHKAGHPVWVHKFISMQYDPAGRPVCHVVLAADVTARRAAEAALALAAQRAEIAQEAAGASLYEFVPRTGEVVRAASFPTVVGYAADELPLTAEAWRSLIHPDDLSQAWAVISAGIEACSGFALEYRVRHKDGRTIWLYDRARVICSADDAPERVVGMILDVTHRKQTEERLRESEQRTRLATEATGVGIWEWNVATGQVRWDAQMFRLYGHSPTPDGFVPYSTWSEAVLPEDLPRQEEVLQDTVRRQGTSYREFRIRRADDGECRILQAVETTRPDARGQTEWVVGTNLDITDRRRAEEEVENGRRTLHAIIEQCPFGIYIVDADFRIATVNAGSVEKAFANVRPLIGRPFEEVMRILWPEPVATDCIAIFRHTLATGEPYRSVDFVNTRADIDRTEGYEWEVHRITLPNGRYGVVCYYFDATRLRLVEQALKEADRKKDEFLATLAHELRNPLAPIRNGLQVMKLAGDDAKVVERSRGMMERQLEQMVRLVDDLMDVSRISRGKVELRKERVPLAAVVNSAVETSRPLIDQMGHDLTVTLPRHPVVVNVDPTRLAQVFMNLLNNAAKYSDRGGHIRLTVERQGSDVVVSVKDTGIGLDADQLPHLFDLFSQVDRSLEKSQGGLGIGLHLVKRLVEMHDGSIEARSEGLGRGSEFVVRLPVVVEASVPPAERDEPAAPKSLLRILIVDDNQDGADSLAMMLKIMGNDTRTAYDGQAGVELAEQYRPDVALFDIGLPKRNGYEACRHIREQAWGKNIIFIAMTGWGQDEDRRRAHDAGFDMHMVKPVDPTALMKLLAELNVVKA